MPTQTKTLANGEVWELRSGACDWHMTSPAEDYAPVSDEFFASYTEAIRAGRVVRDQQEAYNRSFLPKAQ